MSRSELKTKREGGEELKLLREAQGSVRTLGPVTLPPLEAPHAVLTGEVTIMVDHEQDVALHATVRLGRLVVRTVHVQIVIDAHGHRIFTLPEPAKEIQSIRPPKPNIRMTDITNPVHGQLKYSVVQPFIWPPFKPYSSKEESFTHKG